MEYYTSTLSVIDRRGVRRGAYLAKSLSEGGADHSGANDQYMEWCRFFSLWFCVQLCHFAPFAFFLFFSSFFLLAINGCDTVVEAVANYCGPREEMSLFLTWAGIYCLLAMVRFFRTQHPCITDALHSFKRPSISIFEKERSGNTEFGRRDVQ